MAASETPNRRLKLVAAVAMAIPNKTKTVNSATIPTYLVGGDDFDTGIAMSPMGNVADFVSIIGYP